jgi:hypothetical protein
MSDLERVWNRYRDVAYENPVIIFYLNWFQTHFLATILKIQSKNYGPRGRGLPVHGGSVHAMADIWGKIMVLGFWNKNRSRNEIWKNISLSGHVDYSPKFRQKNQRFGHLETIWDGFGHSKYLII